VVAHDMTGPHVAERLHEQPDLFFTSADLIAAFAPGGWTVATEAVRPREHLHAEHPVLDLIVRLVRPATAG